jgi:hypothetical protein
MVYPPKSLVRQMLHAIDRANLILRRSASHGSLARSNPALSRELANIEPAQMARIVAAVSGR